MLAVRVEHWMSYRDTLFEGIHELLRLALQAAAPYNLALSDLASVNLACFFVNDRHVTVGSLRVHGVLCVYLFIICLHVRVHLYVLSHLNKSFIIPKNTSVPRTFATVQLD